MTSDFHSRFREELLTSISRRPRRRTRLVAGSALVGAILAGAVTLLGPAPAEAGVLVTRDDGRVEVLLTDLESSADEVQRVIAEAGLNVQVEAAPVGPSNVGRFVGNTTTGSGLEDIEYVAGAGAAFMGFSIPDHWTGALDILIGRMAAGGESYTIFSDAYAPGEPLACSGTLGRALGAAVDRLEDFTVTVRGPAGAGPPGVPLADALRMEQAGWEISGAYAISEEALLVTVSPTPVVVEEAC